MRWPFQWHFTEQFLRHHDNLQKAVTGSHYTTALALDSLLDRQDHSLPSVIQTNSRVPDNRSRS